MSATITLVGARAGKDPELKFATIKGAEGTAILNLTVAHNDSKKIDGKWVDGPTTWYRVTQFGATAEASAEGIKKGDRVIVTGRLTVSEFKNKDGEMVTVQEINADGLAPMVAAKKKETVQESSGGSPW
jgi:single-strand DNA-binding protein